MEPCRFVMKNFVEPTFHNCFKTFLVSQVFCGQPGTINTPEIPMKSINLNLLHRLSSSLQARNSLKLLTNKMKGIFLAVWVGVVLYHQASCLPQGGGRRHGRPHGGPPSRGASESDRHKQAVYCASKCSVMPQADELADCENECNLQEPCFKGFQDLFDKIAEEVKKGASMDHSLGMPFATRKNIREYLCWEEGWKMQ